MKAGRIQAKDITDEQFLDAIRIRAHSWGVAFSWDVADQLDVPFKVALAKARSMHRRGLLDDLMFCGCGCRGDWKPSTPPES
jgi:hypothetical protein